MATSNSSPPCARFDQFHVDLRSGVLQRSGIRVPVQGQPFQVLRLLLEAQGKVVTREELRKVLWPEDTFVDFELGVNTAVKKLRQALADTAEHPRFIETLPKIGYRFLIPVQWVTEDSENGASVVETVSRRADRFIAPLTSHSQPKPVPSLWIKWPAIAALLGIGALALAVYFNLHRSPKLTDKDTVVLADFANSTGEQIFDDTLKQGLAVQLGQSPMLNILPEQKVCTTLREMTRSPDEALSPNVAQEVCVRTASRAYILGSIANLGGHYVIGLNAIDCASGDVLAREQTEAAGKQQVLASLVGHCGRQASQSARRVAQFRP